MGLRPIPVRVTLLTRGHVELGELTYQLNSVTPLARWTHVYETSVSTFHVQAQYISPTEAEVAHTDVRFETTKGNQCNATGTSPRSFAF